MAWRRGPVPPDTWFYGAIVRVGSAELEFAAFEDTRVVAMPSGEVVSPESVAWYDNSIDPPPVRNS